jgi:hypothetical protein
VVPNAWATLATVMTYYPPLAPCPSDIHRPLSSFRRSTWPGSGSKIRTRLLTGTRLSESPQSPLINFSGEATLAIDPTLLSPVSALLGALVGGGASLLGAIYTQRSQDRVQRVASEIAKRETVYADFVMSASNLLLNAYTHDEIALSGDEQRMIGLINRMRLFAPTDVVDGAEAVLRAIVEISLKPSIELRQLAKEALSKSLDPDPLLVFSSICRADLDNVHRTVV